MPDGKRKDKDKRLKEYKTATRASSQLSVALRNQGLNEDAARFAYRAQVLQRKVLFIQLEQWRWIENVEVVIQNILNWKRFLAFWQIIHLPGLWKQITKFGQSIRRVGIQMQKIGAFLFSFFLDLLAGDGYRPGRTLFGIFSLLLVLHQPMFSLGISHHFQMHWFLVSCRFMGVVFSQA